MTDDLAQRISGAVDHLVAGVHAPSGQVEAAVRGGRRRRRNQRVATAGLVLAVVASGGAIAAVLSGSDGSDALTPAGGGPASSRATFFPQALDAGRRLEAPRSDDPDVDATTALGRLEATGPRTAQRVVVSLADLVDGASRRGVWAVRFVAGGPSSNCDVVGLVDNRSGEVLPPASVCVGTEAIAFPATVTFDNGQRSRSQGPRSTAGLAGALNQVGGVYGDERFSTALVATFGTWDRVTASGQQVEGPVSAWVLVWQDTHPAEGGDRGGCDVTKASRLEDDAEDPLYGFTVNCSDDGSPPALLPPQTRAEGLLTSHVIQGVLCTSLTARGLVAPLAREGDCVPDGTVEPPAGGTYNLEHRVSDGPGREQLAGPMLAGSDRAEIVTQGVRTPLFVEDGAWYFYGTLPAAYAIELSSAQGRVGRIPSTAIGDEDATIELDLAGVLD